MDNSKIIAAGSELFDALAQEIATNGGIDSQAVVVDRRAEGAELFGPGNEVAEVAPGLIPDAALAQHEAAHRMTLEAPIDSLGEARGLFKATLVRLQEAGILGADVTDENLDEIRENYMAIEGGTYFFPGQALPFGLMLANGQRAWAHPFPKTVVAVKSVDLLAKTREYCFQHPYHFGLLKPQSMDIIQRNYAIIGLAQWLEELGFVKLLDPVAVAKPGKSKKKEKAA